MKRLKHWLICRILPIWARETLMAENARLEGEIARLQLEVSRQRAYIAGLETGIRCQRRIVITGREAGQ